MSALKHCLIAAASAVTLGTASAATSALTTDGTWFEFLVGETGDVWRSTLDGDPITFTLTSASPFTLRLVDVGFAGDRVEVVAGGSTVLGTTGAVAADDTLFAFTPDEAFAAPGTWSQGTWLLAAGSYSFSGTATASPFGSAAWAISAVAVPEPATWAMALGGLAWTAAVAARRRERAGQG